MCWISLRYSFLNFAKWTRLFQLHLLYYHVRKEPKTANVSPIYSSPLFPSQKLHRRKFIPKQSQLSSETIFHTLPFHVRALTYSPRSVSFRKHPSWPNKQQFSPLYPNLFPNLFPVVSSPLSLSLSLSSLCFSGWLLDSPGRQQCGKLN